MLPILSILAGLDDPPQFGHVFASRMVLQSAPHAARLWGTAAPGTRVTLSLVAPGVASHFNVTTAANGSWEVTLPPQHASNASFTVSAASLKEAVTLDDVLFGDVFVCSVFALVLCVFVPSRPCVVRARLWG